MITMEFSVILKLLRSYSITVKKIFTNHKMILILSLKEMLTFLKTQTKSQLAKIKMLSITMSNMVQAKLKVLKKKELKSITLKQKKLQRKSPLMRILRRKSRIQQKSSWSI